MRLEGFVVRENRAIADLIHFFTPPQPEPCSREPTTIIASFTDAEPHWSISFSYRVADLWIGNLRIHAGFDCVRVGTLAIEQLVVSVFHLKKEKAMKLLQANALKAPLETRKSMTRGAACGESVSRLIP